MTNTAVPIAHSTSSRAGILDFSTDGQLVGLDHNAQLYKIVKRNGLPENLRLTRKNVIDTYM
jgi:hypothetical protein